MPSVKGKFARWLGGAFMTRAQVASVDEVAPHFFRLVLEGDKLSAEPGTKLQILLPTDDVRTYSPIASAPGQLSLLGFAHGPGPGSRWLSQVKPGDELGFVGPQHSLALPAGPVILVGDETSVAVAASYEAARPGQIRAILQAAAPADLRLAAASVGLEPFELCPTSDTAALVHAVVRAREAEPTASIALTGGSELIVAVRAALRGKNITSVKTKAYWIPGKTGLD